MSVAKRVAEEVGDGMLQRERVTNPLCYQCSIIMLDEARECTITTDVLFGLMKSKCQLVCL